MNLHDPRPGLLGGRVGNSILGSGFFYECVSKEKEQESGRYLAWICMIRALASSVGGRGTRSLDPDSMNADQKKGNGTWHGSA